MEISVGGTVTWENTDTAAHTATSGTSSSGASGHWDSSLVMAGGSYTVSFEDFDKLKFPLIEYIIFCS